MKLKVLINRDEIKKKVKEIAEGINRDYKNKNPILIGILDGSIVFLSDLIRELEISIEIDFVKIKSYAGMESREPEIKLDIERNIEGRDVIIVEDIIDTGVTLNFLKNILLPRKPASLKICALLDKPERRKVDISADYVGFTIPDVFVVGYGLDVDGKYRELPDIHYVEV
ncbi:MAG TPA: hypoxanthine phosphoribosyltransferase [Archaeoglobaceae archaeon]|nr:hypoxanthine phosphoribosyltransferase [Archaeoglobaceae archaeon]